MVILSHPKADNFIFSLGFNPAILSLIVRFLNNSIKYIAAP